MSGQLDHMISTASSQRPNNLLKIVRPGVLTKDIAYLYSRERGNGCMKNTFEVYLLF